MKFLFIILIFLNLHVRGFSDEGMWIPSEIRGITEWEMRKLGMLISSDQIYNENKPSIKDAIVQFGRGCTGEIISDKGLILTNHHCGYSYIQSNSSVQNNYLRDGFWAKEHSEEKACNDLKVRIVRSIRDVTSEVLENVNYDSDEEKRNKKIEENINKIKDNIELKSYQETKIKAFYEGNKYYLFTIDVFSDVRLVAAPPSSIGKYGSDTDNWVWPRHTGDFSLFRIYVNQNNEPAEYSEENKPYKPDYFLPISLKGIKEDDFTMVFGYPGKTNEYLPSEAVDQIVNTINPIRISMRDVALNILDEKMRENDTTHIKYASKYMGISNAWKKWIGQIEGISKVKGIEKKKNFEESFKKENSTSSSLHYVSALDSLNKKYEYIKPYEVDRAYYLELTYLVESIALFKKIDNIIQDSKDRDYENLKTDIEKYIDKFYRDYDISLDKDVFKRVLKVYIEGMKKHNRPVDDEFKKIGNEYSLFVDNLISSSELLDKENILKILRENDNVKDLEQSLKKDNFYSIVYRLTDNYNNSSKKEYDKINADINRLQRIYMEGIYYNSTEKKIYPDANFTLRISFGKVKGFSPKDGVEYGYQTTLSGVMEKYIEGDYEFDLPVELIDIYKKKDFGIYGQNQEMPVAFIATNHTSGGNSGSPVLDRDGNLIGLNFDRVWEGTMSDFSFDDRICRNIMVDVRYILFIIDKLGKSEHLISEMKIVK